MEKRLLAEGWVSLLRSPVGRNKKNSLRSAPVCILGVSMTLAESARAGARLKVACLPPPRVVSAHPRLGSSCQGQPQAPLVTCVHSLGLQDLRKLGVWGSCLVS